MPAASGPSFIGAKALRAAGIEPQGARLIVDGQPRGPIVSRMGLATLAGAMKPG